MQDDMNIVNGELWIHDGNIIYVGDGNDTADVCSRNGLECIIWDREIDAGQNLVMPGFKDAHTHSGMTFLRSFADDMPLNDWLFKQIFPKEAQLTPEDIYHCTKLAILEYLTSGITAAFEMYLTPDSIADATEECGFRCVQVSGMSTQEHFEERVAQLEETYLKHNGRHPLTSYKLGYHAEYTCPKGLLEELSKLSHKYSEPVFAHNSETASEVQGCRDRYGCTPTELADSLGLFDFGGGAFHGVWMSDNDFKIFRKRGLSVVTNPASNAKLASGIAPISRYMKEGINIAIGTDGPASNNCLDMFREMFLTTALGKLHDNDAAAVDADEVLKMATRGGAEAMGLNDCMCLAPGQKADIVIIDLDQPNMQPINNITKNIVYSGSKTNVKMTMVDGKVLYENGRFNIGTEPEQIYKEVNKIIDRMRD